MPAKLALASVAALVPCYWLPRIQAGDLSSHIYNAWLAQLIERGSVRGLVVAHQTTNVLFDLILGALFRAFGPDAAQRVAVGAAALVFFWGAFAFASVVAGRRVWNLLPVIAMLAYGWVFHMGFFNFYLSLGLCLCAMALAWEFRRPWRLVAAGGLLALAFTAHALPVAWCIFLLAYAGLMRGRTPRQRVCATTVILALMWVGRMAAEARFNARWSAFQLFSVTGADQFWVYDIKYLVVLAGVFFLGGLLLLRLAHEQGEAVAFGGLPFQLFILTAGGIAILPGAVHIPGYLHSLTYISERMSLPAALCLLGAMGAVRPRGWETWAMAGVALVFFAFLFHDERALNRLEEKTRAATTGLAPGHRVVMLFDDPGLRVNAVAHMVDRACLGHCYSYANYEPTTAQFRVRAVARNPFVVQTYAESWALQAGTYTVKADDAPLYGLDLEPSGQVVVTNLKAGTRMWKRVVEVLGPSEPGPMSLAEASPIPWRRVLTEAGLLLGFALASSWLVNH